MEKREPAYSVCVNVSWCSQNSMEVPQKTKIRVAIWPIRTPQVAQWVKECACCAGDIGDTGLGRSPGGGHGNSLQYSCLENPVPEEPGSLRSMASQSQTWLKWMHARVHTGQQFHSWADMCTPFFTAALFTKAETWRQPKCPLTDEWLMKTCTRRHAAAEKNNAVCSKVDGVRYYHTEWSQSEKDYCCTMSPVCGL